MLDKDGNRIDRRNAQDIFTPLYNNQIPPGAGFVVHYAFTVPEDLDRALTFEVKLNYRKFDTDLLQLRLRTGYTNGAALPASPTTCPSASSPAIASRFPIDGWRRPVTNPPSAIPPWQRWNDYGIGLLNKGDKGSEKGELIQATHAFEQVEKLGRFDGPVNLARVYFKEGRLDDAVAALQRAATPTVFNPPAPRWTRRLVHRPREQAERFPRQGHQPSSPASSKIAIPNSTSADFDFSRDYEVINELGQTLFERAKMSAAARNGPGARASSRRPPRRFEQTLAIDSENVTAHYNLALSTRSSAIPPKPPNTATSTRNTARRQRPRPRRDPGRALRDQAADHAAQAIVRSTRRAAHLNRRFRAPCANAALRLLRMNRPRHSLSHRERVRVRVPLRGSWSCAVLNGTGDFP
jgi:tetratricopeptide (TPR) repeat protein